MPDDTQSTQPNKKNEQNETETSGDFSTQTFDSSATEISPEHVTLAAIEAESGSIADTSDPVVTEPTPLVSQPSSDYQSLSTPYIPPATAEPVKKSKKGLIAAIVSVAVLVILGGGGAAAYMWYQNPEKVITDGVISAIQAKSSITAGDFEYKADGYSVKVMYDAKSSYETGSAGAATLSVKVDDTPEIKVSGETMYTAGGDIYLRGKELVKTYDSSLDQAMRSYKEVAAKAGTRITEAEIKQLRDTMDKTYRPFIVAIDNRWIKIAADDIKKLDENAGEEYKCSQTALKKMTTDKAFAKQMRDLYKKHQPLIIEETNEYKNNSRAYIIKENKNTSKAFLKDVKQLSAVKEVSKCSKSSNTDSTYNGGSSSSYSDEVTTEVKLWADKWSHELTDFRVSADSNGEFGTWNVLLSGQLSFNKPVTITPPSDIMSFDELKKEAEKITSQFQDSSNLSESIDDEAYYDDSEDSMTSSNTRT
ncbi:hypothetical protein EON76_00405 [bacterium]|nr:MAG: hypothetical protein EON76_00405 [bacterium]